MLSTGTRIGPTRILSWLGEGSTGQSYHCEATEGDLKGDSLFVKLIPREVSEMNGFEDHFQQECQMLEQLEGPGIWPVKAFGVMKWKHWIGYEWLEGEVVADSRVEIEGEAEEKPACIRTLADLLEFELGRMTPELLLDFMISLHCGLYRIHQSGLVHGNLKPSNLLVMQDEKGGEAWVTETGLFRMSKFQPIGVDENGGNKISFLNQDGRSSLEEGDRFRPDNLSESAVPEESWDIHALGRVVLWVLEQVEGNAQQWDDWKSWAGQATESDLSKAFPSVAHSMQALPGIGDLSDYGINVEDLSDEPNEELEAIRERRELEWALAEKQDSLRFRRNMTGFAGCLLLLFSLIASLYLYFMPGPWTEYIHHSPEGSQENKLLLHYKLGMGIFSGQAYGIISPCYDDDGDGGQDAVGKWSREDGLLKLSFRKFKKTNDKEGEKKLWQYIGTGKTKPEDYHVWHDYLRHDQSKGALVLVKRVDEDDIYLPAREGKRPPRLYPEKRLKESKGKLVATELSFIREEEEGINWPLFLSLGFLLASSLYHRSFKKLKIEQEEESVV
jgi:serine/threonine protein kinase